MAKSEVRSKKSEVSGGLQPAASFLAIILAIASPVRPQEAGALQSLRAAAEKGDARAQLAYAKAIKNKPESRDWAMKAAQQGLAEAWFWLGYTAPGGESLPFYEKAAEGGYPEAFPYLFDNLLFRAGEKAQVAKAKKFADIARKLNVNTVDEKDLATADRCAEAGQPEIPVIDKPTPAEIKAFELVDCDRILEGIGQTADPAKYGRCVLADDPLDRHQVAEVYANGYGVKRNAMTAIAFLCHSSDVPAELQDMVDTLYSSRAASKLDEPFKFCDHVTSGFNQGNCALREEAIENARRDVIVASLTKGWAPAQIAAFKKLLAAAEDFFDAHSGSELDMSGTARIAIAVEESNHLRQELLDDVRAFEAGKLPARVDFKTADSELNAVYSKLMRKKDLDLGTVDKDGIRDTQKTWIPFRDAWAAFGAARYPTISVEAWKAWATAKRTQQLKEMLGG